MRKTEILGQGLVEDAERMGEVHTPLDGEIAPASHTPGRTRKIAEAVDRDDDRLLEGRHVKGGGKMREMMFDIVERARESAGPEMPSSTARGPSPARDGFSIGRAPAPAPGDW